MNGTVRCSKCGGRESSNYTRHTGPIREEAPDGTKLKRIVAYRYPNTCRRCRLHPRLHDLWDQLRAAEQRVQAFPDNYAELETLRLLRHDWDAAVRVKPKEMSVVSDG